MIRRFLFLCFFCALSTSNAGPTQGTKTVTTAGTPVQLAATSTLVDCVAIFPSKNTTTANTGNILIGFTSGAGNQKLPLAPTGPPFVIAPGNGKKVDLSGIWLDAANNGDGVVYVAL